MNTILVHPENEQQERELKNLLDSMMVKYEEEVDATDYLLSSKAMQQHLQESIKQANDEKVKAIPIAELWK